MIGTPTPLTGPPAALARATGSVPEAVGSITSTRTLEAIARLGSIPVAPLQIEVEGGSTPVVLAAIATFFVALVLSVLVTYRFVEGYRRTKARPILLLAVGMFLLAPAPMFIRLLVGNVAAIPLSVQLLTTTLSELSGLVVILYVVYSR
ncbi:DUF7521 family protein [Natrialba swarupiae]|uniref:Uncharacterized protein n=1 Tax=Natrialba swarupiae TaxID=2448032 RepID=A0A5D5AVH1_9EURY|nr:hypothetical protein [Natrialba swarupiae]TYT63902.1 hypothetical protein FYC77_01420 [Natrialba swarupiae]